MTETMATWIIGILIAFLTALLGVVWRQINNKLDDVNKRLRTLGHEDRDIRSQMNGIFILLTEHFGDEQRKQLEAENSRFSWIIENMKDK